MFLPILTASKVSNGKKMVGMVVEVWTNDDQRFLYVVTKVKRHVPYDKAVGPADRGRRRAALAPDVRGRGHAAEAPAHRRAAVAGGRRPTTRPTRCRSR